MTARILVVLVFRTVHSRNHHCHGSHPCCYFSWPDAPGKCEALGSGRARGFLEMQGPGALDME